MHRDALAGLGASLRRELGDLLDGGPAALADLDEDARRWLGTMDGEMQTLAAWLTSSSVWADMPVAEPPAPDTPRGGMESEASPSPSRISGATARSGESSAGFERRAPGLRESPSVQRESAPVQRESAPGLQESVPGLRESVPGLRESVPSLRESLPGPREESSRASGRMLPTSGRALPASRAVLLNLGSSAPDLRSSTPDPWEESSRPSGGVLPVLGKSSPGLWEEALEARHRSDGASAPPEPVVPLRPRTDTFTPARSLHDLVRLLSSGEGNDTGANPTVETPRGASPSPEMPAAPDVPATSRRFLEMNAAAGDAPRGVSTVGTISSGPEGALGSMSAPGEAGVSPSPAMFQTPEVDVEPILDALARSVAEEYRRFYGS